MPSPTKESNPVFLPPLATELQAPPSPRTHRALRRLQSAHSLGAKASSQASLITQQRQRELQHHQHQPSNGSINMSPVKRDISSSSASNRSPQRGRANSDATFAHSHHINSSGGSRRSSIRKPHFSHTNLSMTHLIRDGPQDGDWAGALEACRYKILDEGIKSDTDGMSALRIYVWLILLDTPILSTDDYLKLVHRGASPTYSKIRNDTFRTLTTDPLFRRRVSEASLIRLLNAIAWKLHDEREKQRKDRPAASSSSRSSLAHDSSSLSTDDLSMSRVGGGGVPAAAAAVAAAAPTTTPSAVAVGGASAALSMPFSGSSPAAKSRARALTLTTEGGGGTSGSDTATGAGSQMGSEPGIYVQGMNVLAAPFLYAARSEAEAFVAFHALLTREIPAYIRGAMDGVHKGLALVDKVLAIVDPKLGMYLTSKGLKAEIYAFPSVLTLCACTPPLPEVLRLWDFLFAYGPHLNILCIVAQLHLMRDTILKSPSPSNLLRSFPALQADLIKKVTITILQRLPRNVYAEIVSHGQ